MNIDKFYKETLVLSISNIAMGLFRFIFSIILSQKLGSEGLGLYSLIMPIYDLFICVSCGGLVAAISSKGAEFRAKGEHSNLLKTVRLALIFDLLWSLVICILAFFSSSNIAKFMLKDIRAVSSIRLVAIAIIFVSIANVLKGYFLAISKASIPAFIDIFEKLIRVSLVLLAFYLIQTTDITTTVTIVYFSLCAGEGFSLLLLLIFYKTTKDKLIREENLAADLADKPSRVLLSNILIIAIPLAINGFLSALLGTASALILPSRLVSAGFVYEEALSMIGEYAGMAVTITFFPTVIISALSTIIVPEISGCLAQKRNSRVEKRIGDAIRLSLYLGLATIIICTICPVELGEIFYDKPEIYKYIFTAALSAPLSFIMYTTYGIMSGLGKQKQILINSLTISVIDVAILYVFGSIRSVNIYAYAIALLATGLIGVIMNIISIRSCSKIKFGKFQIISTTLISVLTFFIISILKNVLIIPNLFAKTSLLLVLTYLLVVFGGVKLDRMLDK